MSAINELGIMFADIEVPSDAQAVLVHAVQIVTNTTDLVEIKQAEITIKAVEVMLTALDLEESLG